MANARVLFLCTHNSARSQMAEGLLRHLAGDRFEAHSAGTEATHVRPLAIRAMDEVGVDISGQESKTLERYLAEAEGSDEERLAVFRQVRDLITGRIQGELLEAEEG